MLSFAVLLLTLAGYNAGAQVSVSVNIGAQPAWGPVGYDYAENYYMPDIETYYIVERREYVYLDGGRWTTTRALPARYRAYDVYNGYKVVVNERQPWMHHDKYRGAYARYKGHHNQVIIRDSRDVKYYQNPGHPQYAQWRQQQGNDNHGNGRGDGHRGKGHGHGNGHGNNGHGHGKH
ncbi:MAG: hypothetical protein H7257_07055 [Taibaiella sp.]|nr:hypothetical protein [Taibaiella sp.]